MRTAKSKTAIFAAILMLFFAVAKTSASEESTIRSRPTAIAASATLGTTRLAFPEDTVSSATDATHPNRAVVAAQTDQTAFVPLPPSAWAGLGMLIVLIYRKPIFRLVH